MNKPSKEGDLLMSADEYTTELDRSYTLGKIVGLETAAGRLLILAAEAFKRGRDEEARAFRDLAKAWSDEASRERKLYESKRDEGDKK